MSKFRKTGKMFSILMALSIVAGGMSLPSVNSETIVSAAETCSRLLVDLTKNDGRTAAHSLNAENWVVTGETTATTTINGVTLTLTASGGSIRMEDNKKLHTYDDKYSRIACDAATVDADSGGTLTLQISGLSNGTHSVKTYHAATGNENAGGISVSASNGSSMSGISVPKQVKVTDDAGIGYVTFTGTSTTITIKASSGNAWLNGFEIDGGDPIKGVNHVYPQDMEEHFDKDANSLSWTAGSGAKSHNVYIGTSYNDVFNATTSSAAFKGNQTGTSYKLDETYNNTLTPYYWRVDTVDSSGNVIKGSVYSFYVARLAFPTAEGYGRFARGGQGGVVVHVTNLNDSGEGSLRWALCDEKWQQDAYKGVPRIVVFDVGGVITLKERLVIPSNGGSVYVAGQTAPGDGITVTQYDFGAMGSSDVIIRDVRTRVGEANDTSTGGMGYGSCNYSIMDHCSISWATDEGFSSRSAKNITFQWNIIGESLNNSVHYDAGDRTQTERHAFAASISGNVGSFHHNLLIDCTGRNWSLAGGMEQDAVTYGGALDIRNNVVYNWKDRTTDGGVRRLNFVNNYYKAGEVSNTNMHIVSMDGNELNTSDMQKMYVSGNVMLDKSGNYLLKSSDNAWDKGKAISGGKNSTAADVRSDTPFFDSYVNTETAENAYKSVIAGAGAGGSSETGWDYIDSRYIKEVSNGTYTYTGSRDGLKGIIDSQEDAGGYPTTSNFEHSTNGMCNATNDTDRDGMPNAWEKEHGLNPNDASDGAVCTLSADGYTNVEMFLNELMGDPVEYNGKGGSTIKQGAVIDTSNKYIIKNVGSGLSLEVEGSAAANGTDVQQGTTGADGWTLEDAGDGYYRIYSELGDGKTYLLDIDYGKVDNGTNIGIWTDTACDAQLFKFVENEDGTYTIYTKVTEDKSCLGVSGGSKEDGATVVQWESDGTDSQKWTLEVKHDPINGTLIKNLQPKDSAYYSGWAIGESLTAGNQMYGDRTGDKLVTYANIPELLAGSEYIITPCDAKNLTTDLATFEAGADMTVYVGLDSRVTTVPSWLSSWTLTDMTVTSSKDVIFNMYSLEVKAGDTVTLGQNGQSSGCVNYIVAATTKQPEPSAVLGDVDADGDADSLDVKALQEYLVKKRATLTDVDMADCIDDGKLDVFDLVALKRIVGK